MALCGSSQNRGAFDPSVPATVRAVLVGGFSAHDKISLQAGCVRESTWSEEAELDIEIRVSLDSDFSEEDWPKQGITADGSGYCALVGDRSERWD